MVDVDKNLHVNNPANSPMHYNQRVELGVLTPPDYLPVKKLYSYFDGVNLYNQLDYDTYMMQKQAKPKKGKFPPILKVIGGLLVGGLLIKGGVRGIKKLIAKFK
jgi:hypothetical protein